MQHSKRLYLTIDQGGHATRSVVFNSDGDVVAYCEQAIQTQHPSHHQVEHIASDLISSIHHCLENIASQLGKQLYNVQAAGLATQRSNVVCWDKHTGQALSPIISWQDTRATQIIDGLDMDREEIHQATGLFASAHYGASKLSWCLTHLDEVKRARNEKRLLMGPMSSFIVFNILKEKRALTDPVSASRTLLWHIKHKDWDDKLLSLFNIDRDLLPDCVPTCFDYGQLSVGDTEIPLRVVTGDQSAAMYAFGNLQYETAYVNIGTGAFISRPSGYAMIYARRLLTSVIYSDDEKSQYVLEGTVNGAGSAIEWLQVQQPVKDLWKQLPVWLETITNPPLFLNGVSGLAAPYWRANFETYMPETANTAEQYVAVIESIIFLLNANVQEMMKFSSPPQQLQISGGLSQLDGLCQRLSDLTRLPVYRPVECEATARGTAYLAADKPPHWPENEHGHWFKPSNNPGLGNRFQDWEKTIIKQLRATD